ncbi:MAG: acetylglutamate kinase [Elusimicrobia bacterium]|nr:MAG: acetylglutamate kinase [Elusimicrobiota bacterium]
MHKTIIGLKKAIPYIRLYKNKVFVVKVGGKILEKKKALAALCEDVTLLQQLGIKLVLVHGGGVQASELSQKLGIEPKFVAGRRVTDTDTLDVAKMVYAGSLNIEILSALRAHQTQAVGISGVDGCLITATKRPLVKIAPGPGEDPIDVDFGHVGDITHVNAAFLENLLDGGSVPVVSSLAADNEGNVLNINADSIAEALAKALNAEKLFFLTDTDGILSDVDDPSSVISYTDIAGIQKLKDSGALKGGMLPKVDACIGALKSGVRRTHIINGTKPDALLLEAFTNAGCGTMIVNAVEQKNYQNGELGA